MRTLKESWQKLMSKRSKDPAERRRHPRFFLTDQRANVWWDSTPPTSAVVIDASAGGLGIVLEGPLLAKEHEEVGVELSGRRLRATVVHTRPIEANRWRIGLAWVNASYAPRTLGLS